MWSARTSAPTCLEAPVVCAHTLKHTYACFSHGRTCQPADVWHHALSEEEVFPPPVLQCVCVCVCARVGGRRLLSWLMDWTAVSYWAERTGMVTQRNAAEEGFAGRMTWGENSRKARKWISTNQQQQRQQTHTHTHTQGEEMSEDKTPGGPPCLHFPLCQSVPPPVVFISDTAGNPSMTHRSLKCCEPHFARGGGGEDCGSDSKSCLIIPATITTGTTNSTTAAADSL